MLVSGLLNYDRVVLIFVSSRVNIKLSVSSLDKMRALINLQCNRSWHWFPLCYLDPPLINVYKFLVCGVVVWAGRSGGIGVAGGWWCCAKAKEKCDLEDCDRMDVSWEKSTVCCHHVNSISWNWPCSILDCLISNLSPSLPVLSLTRTWVSSSKWEVLLAGLTWWWGLGSSVLDAGLIF